MASSPPDQHRTRWLFFTLLYAVFFSYPLLQVFNRTTLIFGVPLLILYLLLAWLLFIWIIYRFSRRLDQKKEAVAPRRDEENDRP